MVIWFVCDFSIHLFILQGSYCIIQDMFKRFHEKKTDQINKNLHTHTYQQIHKQKLGLQRSYAQRHRPNNRQILKDIKDEQPAVLQLLKTEQFVFQGFVKDGLKQGEGVMMLKNGTMIIGSWQQDLLSGRALLFTPLGSRIVAQFNMGKLNGWAIALFAQHVIKCLLFYQNRLDGDRLTYEQSERMWIASKCGEDGSLISISHMQKGDRFRLPSFIQSEDLLLLMTHCLLNKKKYISLEQVSQMDINDSTNYIGFVDEEQRPCGLGAIYSDRQVYCGNFFEGALEHIGRIFFSNGEVYQGGMIGGVFWQRGFYYSPYKNVTTVLLTNQYEQQIQNQLEGYVLINLPFSIGMSSSNNCIGFKGKSLLWLIEDMQAYYMLQFVGSEKHRTIEPEGSMNSQYGKSQDMNSKQPPSASMWPSPSLTNPGPEQKWLRFGEEDVQKMQQLQRHRSHSVGKRQVLFTKKKNLQVQGNIEPSINIYQSMQIRQNSDYKQAQPFQRQLPSNTKLMQQISFGKKAVNQIKSLDLDQVKIRSHTVQSVTPQRQTQKPVQVLNRVKELQNSRDSSELSLPEQKLRNLLDQGRSHRKKIFY